MQLVDEVPSAVLALLGHWLGDQLEAVGLRHQVGVERAGDVRDVDHLGAHRIADLERRHRARTPDVVDAHEALAIGVHFLDEALEVFGKLRAFRESRHGTQRDFLRGCGACEKSQTCDGRRRPDKLPDHAFPPLLGQR
jgi:hypothetical protein